MTEKPITTEQEAWAAVKKDCMNFKHVPDRLKTHDMCIQSVLWGSRGIMLFWYVPDRLKTADMCCYAVGREGILRWYVPKKFLTVDMLLEAGNDYGYTLNELLSLLLDGREIAGVINRLAARFPPQPFELIRRAAAPRLLRLVRQEAPQTVAVILANIESDKAAYLLQNLPHDTQADIARRIAAMENPSRETLRDLSQELREDEPGDSDSRESEGQADKDTGNRKKRIFLFEDIVMLKDRCIQKVIRELDQRELAKALEGSEKDVQDKIFRNISKRAAVMFKEDMEWLGPIGPELAKEAQEKIIAIIRHLADSGEIIIPCTDNPERMVNIVEPKDIVSLQTMIAISNIASRAAEGQILKALEEEDADLAKEIKSRIFVFESFALLDDKAIQKLLQEIDPTGMYFPVKALKGAGAQIQEKFFRNVSKRMGTMFKKEMETMGAISQEHIEEARKSLAACILCLEDSGKLTIKLSGDIDGVLKKKFPAVPAIETVDGITALSAILDNTEAGTEKRIIKAISEDQALYTFFKAKEQSMERKEFVEQAAQVILKALGFSEKARREGLLAMEEYLDSEKEKSRDIFEYGIRLTVDGTGSSYIEKILSNLINQEQNENAKRLKTIQKEAVLNIQEGTNPRMLLKVLFSYVNNEELEEIRSIEKFTEEDF